MPELDLFLETNKNLFSYNNIVLDDDDNIKKIEIFTFKKIDTVSLKIIEITFSTKLRCEFIEKTNWIKLSKINFKPINVGQFFIADSFHTQNKPLNKILLIINATLAFGTGHHFTTRSCLQLILYLNKIQFNPKKSIDIGCGTGILSIAAAKTFKANIFAIDNDENAIKIARDNVKNNGTSQLVKVYQSKGIKGNFLNSKSRYNLILANILYGPIKSMLPDFYSNLDRGGYLILSGLNINQARNIRKICLQIGLRVVKQICEENWAGLLLKKCEGSF